jgi:hypothetical protein
MEVITKMANTIRIKRRGSGGATGAPESLENAELAFNEADNTLYYGKGTGGAGGTATSVEAIGGIGAFVTKSTSQTITGDKTFSGVVIVPTPTANTHATTKAYVDSAITNSSSSFTAAGDTGTSQTITSADTLASLLKSLGNARHIFSTNSTAWSPYLKTSSSLSWNS